jgi:hypothetical protein
MSKSSRLAATNSLGTAEGDTARGGLGGDAATAKACPRAPTVAKRAADMLDAVGSGTREAGDGTGEGTNVDPDDVADTLTVIDVAVDALGTAGVRRMGAIDNDGMLDILDDDESVEAAAAAAEEAEEEEAEEEGAVYACATSRGTYSDTRTGKTESDVPVHYPTTNKQKSTKHRKNKITKIQHVSWGLNQFHGTLIHTSTRQPDHDTHRTICVRQQRCFRPLGSISCRLRVSAEATAGHVHNPWPGRHRVDITIT